MKNDAFSGFHPAVNLAFFLVVLGLTMFIQQPVYPGGDDSHGNLPFDKQCFT